MSAILVTTTSTITYANKIDECKRVLLTFDTENATVTAMENYANCVNFLYPTSMDPSTEIFFKFLFVLALIGACVGVFISREEDLLGKFVGLLAGFVFVPVLASAIFGVLSGIRWLFT